MGKPGGAFLRKIPFFYRLLLANSVVVVAGAVIGSWLTVQAVRSGHFSLHLYALLVAVAIVISAGINFLVLRLAMRPLDEVQRVIRAVESGEAGARVDLEQMTDRDLKRFASLFNEMLDQLEENARVIQSDREQIRRMALAVLNAQEEERRRIARELHDQASQALSVMLVGIDTGLKAMPPSISEGHQQLTFLKKVATSALEDLRELSRSLHPTVLDDLGLLPAVRWYARNTLDKAGVNVKIVTRGMEDRLPPEMETAVFRIVQESCSNILRHAGAKNAEISLVREGGVLHVLVKDDGVGFDVKRVKERGPHHLGLVGMEERARLLGGTFEVRSSPGEGTVVEATIPVKGWDWR